MSFYRYAIYLRRGGGFNKLRQCRQFTELPTDVVLPIATGVLGTIFGYLSARTQYSSQMIEATKSSASALSEEKEKRASLEGQCSRMEKEIERLRASQRTTDIDTGAFLKSLTAPHVIGRWGELSLRRVVELSGMAENVDFNEQVTISGSDGESIRVDMLITMHNKRYIVVDSKVPFASLEDALAAKDDKEKKTKLKVYVSHLRKHINELSSKKYWAKFESHPEFVVAFVPSESFYSTALREDPSLIDFCLEKRVILASPITLIALFKVLEYGWRQSNVSTNVEDIKGLMKEQHERVLSFTKHFGEVGKHLEQSVKKYNEAVGSLESRLLPSTRKVKELGVVPGEDIPLITPVDREVRGLSPTKE